jgi:hypothetical protein
LNPAVQTAEYAEYAEEEGVELAKALNWRVR